MTEQPNRQNDAGPPPDAVEAEDRAPDSVVGAAPEEAREAEARELPPPTPEELLELRKRAAERDEYLELLKRARADFANYRKRVDEDRKRWGEVARRDLMARLLSAADQCRLVAQKSKEDDSAESLRGCIDLIWAELERFLDSSGVKPIAAKGESFDPDRHEAVFVRERHDLPDATVIDEVRAGYELGGHVLRPAQVVVSKRPKPPEPEQPRIDGPETEAEGDGAAEELG